MLCKKNALALLVSVACSSTFAADPLVTKVNASGFSLEPTRKVCEVYSLWTTVSESRLIDGEFVEKQYSRWHGDSLYEILLESNRIHRALKSVQNETLVASDNFICDAPTTNIKASVEGEDLVLFSSGGCGSDRLKRRGPNTEVLSEIASRYCSVTHDIGFVPEFYFDLSDTAKGWEVGFSDYPVGQEDFYELNSEWQFGTGLFVTGNNHSDDLFMFVKRQVTGLEANTTYDVELSLEIASNSPKGCFGIGGAPGESVYVKAGVSLEEPKAIVQGSDYQLNIDKGNQSQSGTNVIVVGDVGVGKPGDCNGEKDYELKSFNSKIVTVTTDDNGSAWIIFGTDSGYEGTTSLYFTKASAVFTENYRLQLLVCN